MINTETDYIDNKGRKWQKFEATWYHDLDDQYFSVVVWAIDYADFLERIEFIKNSLMCTEQRMKLNKGE
jgi:hypothetical protein